MMNNEGYVPLKVLASFNRVRALTGNEANIMLIRQAVQGSLVVETSPDGEMIRRRGNWYVWVLPKSPSPTVGQPRETIQDFRVD